MDFNKEKIINEYNFVFTLWKFPKLYNRFNKKIEQIDNFFSNQDARFFYILGKQMYLRGFTEFDICSVMTYVGKNDRIKEAFESKGGYDTFTDIKDSLSYNNVDGYFNEIIKINCLETLQNEGFDIDKDYHKLSQMTVEQIRLFYSYKLNNTCLIHSSESHIESVTITDEDLFTFNEGLAMGLSIANTAPLLNYEILGVNKGLTFIGGMINTGKTSFSLAIPVMGFLKDNRKVCLISNEQTILEFKQILMSMVSYELFGSKENDLNRRRIKVGHYNTSEWDKLKQVQIYFNEKYAPLLSFSKIFDYRLEDVQRIIEVLSAQGYEAFLYDVFKADNRMSGKVIDEMVEMSKSLFKSADTNKVAVLATIQLGLGYEDYRTLTMTTISTSKQIPEPATEVLLIRDMWDDEVTGGKNDIKIYNYAYNSQGQKIVANGKPIKKFIEVVGDEYKSIKLVFIAKTRNTDRGIVIAYKFNGDYNTWEELGYCTPGYETRNKKK